MGRSTPGDFELVVLLALAGFEAEASGRDVYEVVTTETGREVSVAAVHITLSRMADKGWAACRTQEPAPHVGGKPRKRYSLSQEGAHLLTDQRAQLERLWGIASNHPLLDGDPS